VRRLVAIGRFSFSRNCSRLLGATLSGLFLCLCSIAIFLTQCLASRQAIYLGPQGPDVSDGLR
jgi:hypothetical protein